MASLAKWTFGITICAILIGHNWTTVHAKPHGVAVIAPVVPVVAAVPAYPVAPYYAVPKRCYRKPHTCVNFYGPPAPPPPPPPPPPRPYYGGYRQSAGVAAVGVGVFLGK